MPPKGPMEPLKRLLSLMMVCSSGLLLVQVTVVPTGTVKTLGMKSLPTAQISLGPCTISGRGGGGAAGVGAVGVGVVGGGAVGIGVVGGGVVGGGSGIAIGAGEHPTKMRTITSAVAAKLNFVQFVLIICPHFPVVTEL